MQKRILAIILVLAVVFGNMLSLTAFAQTESADSDIGTTYYVSTKNGSDENTGTSKDQAFYSLQMINAITLQPGDQVLLERGSIFQNGYLHVKGSGSAEAPIIIDCYGDESEPKPLINTNGAEGSIWHQDYNVGSLDSSSHVLKGNVSSSILLYDVEYIEISNIAMKNGPYNPVKNDPNGYSYADKMDRTGVAGVAQNIGTVDHIVLRNLDISEIAGNVYNKHMCNGGIYLVCHKPLDEAATGIAKYDDVLIEGCTVSEVSRWGIAVGYTAYYGQFTNAAIPDDVCIKYGSTNVVIRDNYVYSPGGDVITLMYCFEPLVEHNVGVEFVREMNSAYYTSPVSIITGKNRGGMVAAGIWPWKCKTPVFQYNECYDAIDNQDAQAWDADYGDGAIYQYNYSANNEGGALMICGVQAINTIFRYNISQNDGNATRGVLSWADSHPNGEVYNNVFYIKENVPVFRPAFSGGVANIYNNIFYYAGSTPASASLGNWAKNRGTWSNNIFYNFSTLPADANAITADPLFVNGGSAPNSAREDGKTYDRSVFEGYKLQANSPAIDAGKPVANNGGLDFFGNVADAMPDIGAYDAGTYVVAVGADITSTPYALNGRTLYVPSVEKNPTTTDDVLGNIEVSDRASAAILFGGEEIGRAIIEDGMIIRVTSESGGYQDYTIRIKNSYNFAEDYSSTQGNVWFYQYKKTSDQTYYNMPVQDEWGGWMESYNPAWGTSNSWATISLNTNNGDGICSGPVRLSADVESSAMAWRAPKSGTVILSFGGGAYDGVVATRGNITGGTVYFRITKNGEDVIVPIALPAVNGSIVSVDNQVIAVEKGDYIRLEAQCDITGPGEITSPGFHATPIFTYANIGDSEAPTAPGNLRVSQIQDAKTVVGWDVSTDNVGVEGYKVYLNGTLVQTTTINSVILTGLTKGKAYTVEVAAFDLASNYSEKATGSFTAASADVIYTLPEPVKLNGEGMPLSGDVLNASKGLNTITVTAQFTQSGSGIGDIVSFSLSTALGEHFHIYINGARFGYELRGTWGNRHYYADVLDAYGPNSIAVVANPADYSIKLFANGALVHTMQWNASTWRMLKDFAALDTATIGYCYRDHVSKYAFTGDIYDVNLYSSAMSDEYMKDYTRVPFETAEKEKHIFSATGAFNFRIPALLTLNDGTIMAATDARFGSYQDSPNNLDTAVAFRRNGDWKDATIPLHFVDVTDKPGYASGISASYIDPVIVQGNDDTIYVLSTTFPYGTGSSQSNAGSGMVTVDGAKYLALTAKGSSVTNWSNFTLYIDSDGVVRDVATKTATGYTVDANYNLSKDGVALTVEQKNPNGTGNGVQVPMNIFYQESALQVYRTAYITLIASKDNGYTWSAPVILNDLKLDSESFYGTGPGRGFVTETGRILIPIYTTDGTRGERSSVIYSDDNGATWNRGPATTLTSDTALDPKKTSEAQFVSLPDGTIRMYARGTTGYVGYADSTDGGVTFGNFQEDPQLAYCGNSMVSVINYSKEINGKPALILSAPEHRDYRGDGIIRVGLIEEDGNGGYTVDWKYRYEVNREDFIYSCLTELPDGRLGILYETYVEQSYPLTYEEFELKDLLLVEDSAIASVALSPENPQPGDTITVTVTMKSAVTNPAALSGKATLEILYPASGLGKGTLAFSSISSDNLVVTYTGTLPASENPYDFIIRMPEYCGNAGVGVKTPVITTASGLVNPANKDTLYGTAGLGEEVVTVSASVTTPVLVETLSAYLNITATGEGLDGKTLKAYFAADGVPVLSTETLLTLTDGVWKGRMYIAEAPAYGSDCAIVIAIDEGSAQDADCPITLAEYKPALLWEPSLIKDSETDGLLVCFSEQIAPKNNGVISVTIGGVAVNSQITADQKGLLAAIPFNSVESGTAVVVAGVKYPALFPSYSFTFTLQQP